MIGVKREQAIESLLTQMPVRFETSEEDPWLMGVLISCSRPLRADSIEQILMPRPPGGRSATLKRPSSASITSGKNHGM